MRSISGAAPPGPVPARLPGGRSGGRPSRPDRLSAAQARRTQLAAQGFGGRRPGERGARVDRRHFRRVLDRLSLVQLDSVNVITRAHELTFFARLGPYDRGALARWLHDSGEAFEYWGHAASFLPVDVHPYLRWKMAGAYDGSTWKSLAVLLKEHPEDLERVRAAVRERGPITAADLHDGDGPRRTGPWWGWDLHKRALEALFWAGELTATRGSQFQRLYDLPERVLPPDVLALPTPSTEESRRELLRRASSSLGIATATDLATYFYQVPTKVRPIVKAMAADGELLEVAVDGWSEPGYLHPGARVPARLRARALLAPFDSLTFDRARAERVFGFSYRIEIYTPAPKRVYGYYVLPFLLGDRLVGRIDLKAERAGRRLLVHASWAEDGVDHEEVAVGLAEEVRLLAGWLDLDEVVVGDRGNLAPALWALLPVEGRS